jgi:hypothetical protein
MSTARKWASGKIILKCRRMLFFMDEQNGTFKQYDYWYQKWINCKAVGEECR